MNFTAIKWCGAIGVAAGAAIVFGGGSASAQSISGVLRFNISASNNQNSVVSSVSNTGIVFNSVSPFSRTFDFTTATGGGSEGTFRDYLTAGSNIGTITLTNLNTSTPTSFVVTLSRTGLQNLVFNTSLFSGSQCTIGASACSSGDGTFSSNMTGSFSRGTPPISALSQPTTSISASRTTGNGNGNVDTSISLTLTPVPTPALVPAAVGFGLAMLRKRKQEQAEETAIEKV